jgi:hypothetical protein
MHENPQHHKNKTKQKSSWGLEGWLNGSVIAQYVWIQSQPETKKKSQHARD